ncbi:MAG: sulfatase [Planctomycetota bacterium]
MRSLLLVVLLLPTSPILAKAPNFVVFLVDDLGYMDLSCYGSSFYETPNLDRLAASGLRWTQGYAAHPVCSPTRAALMTGKNPARLRITDWIPGQNPKNRPLVTPNDRHQLALEEVTIAERMRSAGYKTFFAGKWHLGSRGYFPEDQGFDINKGGHHKGSPPGGYYAPYKNPKLKNGPDGEYLPDRLTNETIQFIEAQQKPGGSEEAKPFFAYLSFYTVHTPIQASKKHFAKFREKAAKLPKLSQTQRREHHGFSKLRQDDARYASMIYAMDENVGRVLAKLDELRLTDSTVVVFTSDNGGLSTLHRAGRPTSNLPLRAGKGWCYEGGIRVPWIIRAPGVTKPGSTSATPIYSADLYPTLLELAGLDLDPKQHADGLSLVPVLRGGTVERKSLVWHYPHYHGSAWRPGSAIRAGRYKLIEFYETNTVELYDLESDLEEMKDLASSDPKRATALRKMLHEYLESVGAQMTEPRREDDLDPAPKKKRKKKNEKIRRS